MSTVLLMLLFGAVAVVMVPAVVVVGAEEFPLNSVR